MGRNEFASDIISSVHLRSSEPQGWFNSYSGVKWEMNASHTNQSLRASLNQKSPALMHASISAPLCALSEPIKGVAAAPSFAGPQRNPFLSKPPPLPPLPPPRESSSSAAAAAASAGRVTSKHLLMLNASSSSSDNSPDSKPGKGIYDLSNAFSRPLLRLTSALSFLFPLFCLHSNPARIGMVHSVRCHRDDPAWWQFRPPGSCLQRSSYVN